jgi:hypothetical protein
VGLGSRCKEMWLRGMRGFVCFEKSNPSEFPDQLSTFYGPFCHISLLADL